MDKLNSVKQEKQIEILFNNNIYNCILRLNENQLKIEIEKLPNNIKYRRKINLNILN